MSRGTRPKQKDRPNQRQMAFRQEAVNDLLELEEENQLTFEKAMEVAKLDCQQCKFHDAAHNPKHQNCRDNPFCIFRLGLEKFEKLISAEVQNREDAKKDQKRRDLNDQPTGLINSGNFCYVNSFLQVWFNVLDFRQIVYDFRPSDNYIVPEHPKMDVQKVMLALQDLFFTLQTTPFYDTDKNNQLIRALRLNTEQQDAQEFTLMLFDALDRNLQLHPNGQDIRERIRKLYMGKTCTRIFCECGMSSNRTELSTSLQLNIDGHSTLLDALNANFGVEKLDDYKCSICERQGHVSKQNDYIQLPPVLIIQLNRYKYTSKGRQKLKTLLAYPREIPAKSFQRSDQTNPPPAETYELFAVTIHEGNNAECGHYYDLVKAPLNQKWYRYNDANVEALTKLPGTEKPTTALGEKTSKRAKDKEKTASDQKACYGLLYKRKDAVLPLPHPKLPPEELIAKSKKDIEDLFEGQTKSKIEKSEKRLYDLQRRVEKLKNKYSKLETHEGKYKHPNEIAFIPTKLISNILEQEYETAKGKGKKESEKSQEETKGESPNNEKGIKEAEGEVSTESVISSTNGNDEMDNSICEMETTIETTLIESDGEKTNDVDLLALAMTSSEIPTDAAKVKSGRTRAQNGISKSVFGHTTKNSPRKTNGITKPPLSTRVAALLDSHSMQLCGHGKMPIETILFGDVKAVSRAPAIALLREYDYRSKIVYDDGKKEYPAPEKDKEVFVFTAEDICMDCVREMRRGGIFNNRLDDDEKMAKKILKEEKLRCSVKNPDQPDDNYYVAKVAIGSFKKLAIAERNFNLSQQLTKTGTLVFESSSNQKLDSGFPVMVKKRGRVKKSTSDLAIPQEKLKKCQEKSHIMNGREYTSTELPEQLLEGEEDDEVTLIKMEEAGSSGEQIGGGEEDGEQTRSSRSTTEVEDTTRPSSRSTPASNNGPVEFNCELRCSHGGVNYNQFRHSVTPEEWQRLKYYFTDCYEVRCSDEVCALCQQLEVDAQNGSENMRVLVREMRKRLTETLKKIDGRTENRHNKNEEELTHGICSQFVEKLKKLSTRSSTTPPQICQSCLLCRHGMPYKKFGGKENSTKDSHVIGITREEWNIFREEIANLEKLGDESVETEIPTEITITDKTIDNLCVPCYEQYVKFKEDQKYMFENENIYVRLVNPFMNEDEEALKVSGKSTRRRKNLFTVKMSSSSKLLDLKVALYEKCYQLPTDQLLYRNAGGDSFDASNNEKTLYDLRILPNNNDNPLVLITQPTGTTNPSTSEDSSDRAPERGFVDTALAH